MALTKQVNGEPVECTPEEEAAFLAEWAANTPTAAQVLLEKKLAKVAAIDAKTDQLLAAGFAYTPQVPGSVQGMFGLDAKTVSDWTGLMVGASALPPEAFPFTIADVSGNAVTLASAADIGAFYATGLTRAAVIKQGGVALKVQARDAADEAALDAVIDSRT